MEPLSPRTYPQIFTTDYIYIQKIFSAVLLLASILYYRISRKNKDKNTKGVFRNNKSNGSMSINVLKPLCILFKYHNLIIFVTLAIPINYDINISIKRCADIKDLMSMNR